MSGEKAHLLRTAAHVVAERLTTCAASGNVVSLSLLRTKYFQNMYGRRGASALDLDLNIC